MGPYYELGKVLGIEACWASKTFGSWELIGGGRQVCGVEYAGYGAATGRTG